MHFPITPPPAIALSNVAITYRRTAVLFTFVKRERGRMDPLQRAEASRWRITLISLFLAGKLVARLADADEELTANYASSRWKWLLVTALFYSAFSFLLSRCVSRLKSGEWKRTCEIFLMDGRIRVDVCKLNIRFFGFEVFYFIKKGTLYSYDGFVFFD